MRIFGLWLLIFGFGFLASAGFMLAGMSVYVHGLSLKAAGSLVYPDPMNLPGDVLGGPPVAVEMVPSQNVTSAIIEVAESIKDYSRGVLWPVTLMLVGGLMAAFGKRPIRPSD